MIKTLTDLRRQWGVEGNTLLKRISYGIKTGKLFPIRRGMYRQGRDVSTTPWTLDESWKAANVLQTPSYISFETILGAEGVVFQFSDTLHVAAGRSTQYALHYGGPKVQTQRMPHVLLTHPLGLHVGDGWVAARPERAVADTLYRSPGFHLDDTSRLDSNLLESLAQIYSPFSQKVAKKLLKIAHENQSTR